MKTFKVISNLVLVLLIVCVCTVVYFVIQSKGDIQKSPSLLGYKPLTVLTNSMTPTFSAGDIIIINTKVDPKLKDVITYKHPEDGKLITHRVIDMTTKNGESFYKTQGDANNVDDKVLIPRANVVGIESHIIPNGGFIANKLASPFGFSMLVIIPLLIYLIIEIFQRLGLLGVSKEKKA